MNNTKTEFPFRLVSPAAVAQVADDGDERRTATPASAARDEAADLSNGVSPVFSEEQVQVVRRIHQASEELLRSLQQMRSFAASKPALALRPLNRKSILIVDDEKSFREILRHILEEEGYDVAEAVDGKDAMSKLSSLKPHLLLLDLCLPDVDGWEVIRHLKSHSSLANVKVLALSGLNLEEGQVTALKALTWGFLPKAEFTVEAMRRQLARLLGPK